MNRLSGFLPVSVAILLAIGLFPAEAAASTDSLIEKQLKEIGQIPNEEVIVVQRKYTRKNWRHELTPISFGGLPFGTVRRTLFGGAGYTLHVNDWLAWEVANFVYSKTFFSSFTDDINDNKVRPTQADIKPDFQKLLFFLTTGIQIAPFHGKMSTMARWIAYAEPYLSLNVGLAKTETSSYLALVPGIGLRIFFKEWFSMKFEFRDYYYTEQFQTRTNPSVAATAGRHNFAVSASLSFWLPKM